jgi:flagellar hook-associated protein 3 FlgL
MASSFGSINAALTSLCAQRRDLDVTGQNVVTQMKQAAQDRLLDVTSQLSDVEDVDPPTTIMELQLQQASYQAALAASARVIQPSLIDFLR